MLGESYHESIPSMICVSWILKRLMITLVVMHSSICWGRWDLGRNGRVGFILVFLLFTASLVIHGD